MENKLRGCGLQVKFCLETIGPVEKKLFNFGYYGYPDWLLWTGYPVRSEIYPVHLHHCESCLEAAHNIAIGDAMATKKNIIR